MTRNAANRNASLAALALALGLIWPGAPASACAPPGDGAPSGGSPASGGEVHQNGSDSQNNGAADDARQGAAAAAAGSDNSDDGGPSRSSPMTAIDHAGQIGSVGAGLATANDERCARLQLELSSVLISASFPSPAYEDRHSQEFYDQAVKMTPDQLDRAIARARKMGVTSDDADLSFVMDLRASQILGLEDDVKKRYRQRMARAAQQAAQEAALRAAEQDARQHQRIHDLQSQMAELDCAGRSASALAGPGAGGQ